MASVRTDTEREVEMHFASPLFREGFGYSEEQEAAGFGIRWARAASPGHVEADLLYFAGDKHDVKAGEPLVLVECKRLIKDEKEAPGGSRPGAQLRAVGHPRLLRDHRRQDRERVGLPGRRRSRQGTAEGEPGASWPGASAISTPA
jgi:hypothetical protein